MLWHSGKNSWDAFNGSDGYPKNHVALLLNLKLDSITEDLLYMFYFIVQRVKGYTREAMPLKLGSIVAVGEVRHDPLYQATAIGNRPALQAIEQTGFG